MHPIIIKALDQLLDDLDEERIAQRIELANETEPGPRQIIRDRLAALHSDAELVQNFLDENQ